jgi:hypothetical protein
MRIFYTEKSIKSGISAPSPCGKNPAFVGKLIGKDGTRSEYGGSACDLPEWHVEIILQVLHGRTETILR